MSGHEPSRGEVFHLVDVRLDNPRGGPPLVAGANLGVARGEVVLVVGAAGAGTSRLVAAALGEVRLDNGQLDVLGRDVSKLRRSSLRLLRRRIGIVPQDLCLLEDRSVQLNVVLPLEIDGIPRSASVVRAALALTRLGLDAEASLPVDCLSSSARQRVAVARALVRDPELVIADHPTSMQDEEGAELVCGALADAARRGAACLVFGRDPTLRAIAERNGWRQLGLVGGVLSPLAEMELVGRSIEDVLVEFDFGSEPVPLHSVPDPEIPNVIAFPTTARTVAGGVG
ncbi:MAG: transporter related protein [Deltaproteobacteria bacterium]|nr:transporter related protein [Deltaproteobacteria bacterium]